MTGHATTAPSTDTVGGGGVGGVRPDEKALKQRTRWTGVFFLVFR